MNVMRPESVERVRLFRERIEKYGTPNRLNVSDSFGYWFSGLFDGEGCLLASKPSTEHITRIHISLRNDDLSVLRYIQKNIRCGNVLDKIQDKPNRDGYFSKPASYFYVLRPADLVEIIIPLFDKYPLMSKKKRQYGIWKELVLEKYIHTLGGTSRFPWPKSQSEAWVKKMLSLRNMKIYKEK